MLRCQAMDIVCTSWDDDVDAKSMLPCFVLTNMATRMNYETAYTCRSMCLSTKIMVEEGGRKGETNPGSSYIYKESDSDNAI